MKDKPTNFPTTQPDGEPLKPITQVLLERRATMHFTDEEVPEEYLNAILNFGGQAPSGYNLQPWRFIVVRDAENRKRLQKVAYNQPKVAEAPVVLICFGMQEEWKERAGEVFREGAERGAGDVATWQQARDGAVQALSGIPAQTWLNRHTMIAVTTMMLGAEAYAFATTTVGGLDPAGVKREFSVPNDAEVVALLAIGRLKPPDKAYPGRFGPEQVAFRERYGERWPK